MNCPNCSQQLTNDSRTCPQCSTEFKLTDWTQLQQYDYLLSETKTWQPYSWQGRRRVIVERAAAFRQRWAVEKVEDVKEVGEVKTSKRDAVDAKQTQRNENVQQTSPTSPLRSPKQPFEQWLFSEGTIKSALYSGAFLLILAGMIFVGANWSRLVWTTKLAVMAAQTVLMTVLGLKLLNRSSSLRIGGLALTAVAVGFAPLNTWLIQHYWLRPIWDFDPYLMLFLGGLLCTGFYIWLIKQTKSSLHSMSATLALSASLGGLVFALVDDVGLIASLLATIPLLILTIAYFTRGWDWIEQPPRIIAHVEAILCLIPAVLLLLADIDSSFLNNREAWHLVSVLAALTGFYALAEHWWAGKVTGWMKYAALLLTLVFATTALELDRVFVSFVLIGLAGLFLLAYFRPIQIARLHTFYASIPLVLLAILVGSEQLDPSFAWVLVATVAYLAACAFVSKQSQWQHAALWLMIAPIAIFADAYAGSAFHQSLWFTALLFGYLLISQVRKQDELILLAPAAALSAIALVIAWEGVWWGVVLLLLTIGAAYAFYALRWRALTMIVVLLVNLLVLRVCQEVAWQFGPFSTIDYSTLYIVSFATLGFASVLLAAFLRKRAGWWRTILYIAGSLNLIAVYTIAQSNANVFVPITLAFLIAISCLAITWYERDHLLRLKYAAGSLTAIALILSYIAHIQLMLELKQYWPSEVDSAAIITVLLCSSFVLIGLTMRKKLRSQLYGQPLNLLGIGLMLLPLTASINNRNIFATVAAIAGSTILLDGWKRSQVQPWRMYQIYSGIGVLLIALCALLDANGVTNLQVFAMPIGLVLVLAGWNERRRNVIPSYVIFSMFGLLILFGSAFLQSLDEGVIYAYLLLIESVIAVRWGIVTLSRGYVQLGIVALVANGIAQFGPAFSELPRFAQVGSIGSILLLGGLIALFQREQLLATQDAWKREWAKWNP